MRVAPNAPMNDLPGHDGRGAHGELAGVLAHLARHMETGCPRAGSIAALLLERIAANPDADGHLRRHAAGLAELLQREDRRPGGALPRGPAVGCGPALVRP